MFCKYLTNDEYSKWNQFVDESPEGSIYGKSWYLDALQVNYRILVVEKDNQIYGGIVLTKNEIFTFSNPLFVKYLGIFFPYLKGKLQNITSEKYKICELIISEIKHIKTFDYTFNPNFTNWLPFFWNGYKQTTYYSYRLNIQDDSMSFKRNFDKSLNYDIRKAESLDYQFSEIIDSDIFYKILSKSFEVQNSKPPFSKKKIHLMQENLKDNMITFGVKNNNEEFLAVCGLIYDQHSCYLILNGMDYQNSKYANQYLLSKAIEQMMYKGITIFDFEGSIIKRIESFYRQFGGVPIPYFKIHKDNMMNSLKSNAINYYKKIKFKNK